MNASDREGWTVLMRAVDTGYITMVKALTNVALDAVDKEGKTALMLAAYSRPKDIARHLISSGAKLNIADKEGKTALMFAAQRGHTTIVKQLINAKADLNIADKTGWTALHLAANATLQLTENTHCQGVD